MPLRHRCCYVWISGVALAATRIEASRGDRNWLYAECLDTCVEKGCGVTYHREDPDYDLSPTQVARKRRLLNRLDLYLSKLPLFQQQQQRQLQQRELLAAQGGRRLTEDVFPEAPSGPDKDKAALVIVGEAAGRERRSRDGGGPWHERGGLPRNNIMVGRGVSTEGTHGRSLRDRTQQQQKQPQQPRLHPPGGTADEELAVPVTVTSGDSKNVRGSGGGGGGGGGDGRRGDGRGDEREGIVAAASVSGDVEEGLSHGLVASRRVLTAQDVSGGVGQEERGAAGRKEERAAAPVVMQAPIAATDAFDRYAHQPPWHLRAMGWDCVSECRYTCMNLHVEDRASTGEDMLQYYGKWPFRRVWGVQELFSSLFSAGNGLPHLYHVLFSPGLYNPSGNYMKFWLTLYPWVGMNTWLWSAVFHARDVPWTEAADYFFALLNIFFVVWIALLRLAGPPRKRSPRLRRLVPVVGVAMSAYYLLHVSFMWFVKFDYGYNMKVALLAGVVHTGLWLRYQYLIRERHYAARGAMIIILLNAAILLEVNDFPPVYRLLDAHAIWHFVTIPLMFQWYRFFIQDATHEVAVASSKTT